MAKARLTLLVPQQNMPVGALTGAQIMLGLGTALRGEKGDRGLQGEDGVDGLSAYQLAVSAGFVGDEAAWLLSLEGPAGAKGDAGAGSTVPGPPGASADLSGDTHAATAKTTPADADEIPLVDSAASWVLKKLTWANLKATLAAYFDGIYQAILVSGTNLKTINSTSLLGSGDIVVGADFASPGPIGGTTPSTVKATNIDVVGGTVTSNLPIMSATQTWNAGGTTFNGIAADFTDLASASNSSAIKITLNSYPLFNVQKNGVLKVGKPGWNRHAILDAEVTGFVIWGGGDAIRFLDQNYGDWLPITVTSLGLKTAGRIAAGPSFPPPVGVADIGLARASAGVWEINSGTASDFRDLKLRKLIASGSHTDASSGRWLELSMDSAGIAKIKPTGNGTGVSGNVLHISGLPASNPGPGILWNNAGVVAIGT